MFKRLSQASDKTYNPNRWLVIGNKFKIKWTEKPRIFEVVKGMCDYIDYLELENKYWKERCEELKAMSRLGKDGESTLGQESSYLKEGN